MDIIYAIRYTPDSIDDLQKAISNCDHFSPGSGSRFIKEFQGQVTAISKRPHTRAVRYEDVRFALIKRFHYAIHYTIR